MVNVRDICETFVVGKRGWRVDEEITGLYASRRGGPVLPAVVMQFSDVLLSGCLSLLSLLFF